MSATARGRTDASALPAWRDASARLIGLMPVVSLWRAWKIPLPALVSAHPYGTLCTPADRPRLRRSKPRRACCSRRAQAGAHALILRDVALDGAAMTALKDVLRPRRPEAAHALQSDTARQPRRDAGW